MHTTLLVTAIMVGFTIRGACVVACALSIGWLARECEGVGGVRKDTGNGETGMAAFKNPDS